MIHDEHTSAVFSEYLFRTSDSKNRHAPTAANEATPYVLGMRQKHDDDLARILSTFILECHPEPVIVLDSAGVVRELNRAARDDRHRRVLEFLEAGTARPRVRDFLDDVRRSGRASMDLPRLPAPITSGSFVLEGFAVDEAIVIVAHDQSERRALEEELRQLRRIESLSLVTASVIHDFNNLMTPMLALSSNLANELRASSSSLELVADIESIASRTASLFRDIVAAAKPARRTQETLNVAEVLFALRPLLQRVAGPLVGLSFKVEDQAVRLSVERSRLEHALLNLVANAREAMPDGGTITIAALRAEDPDVGSGTVLLAVSDTGLGMTEHVRAHACDDFFTTRDTTGGTGLGLASVRRFVTENGGQVTLDSEPSRGTTVTIHLPVASPASTR
jgi:two-component system, cell cycle sensor histidine kinase and response regulator CckA